MQSSNVWIGKRGGIRSSKLFVDQWSIGKDFNTIQS